MFRLPLIAALLFGVSSTVVMAGETPVPLNYEIFEAAVPHIDLEECPPALAADNRFCRATLAREEVHVFAFTHSGKAPLVAVASFPADGLVEVLK